MKNEDANEVRIGIARGPNTLGAMLREAAEGEETAFEVLRETLGDGDDAHSQATVRVQRRRLQPEPPNEPIKAPSPKRAHLFHDAAAMIAYLGKYRTADTVILADAVEGIVSAVIDEKAERGFEVVMFTPQRHPLFTPWLDRLGQWMTMRAAIEFLLDNRRTVIDPDGKQFARDLSQIKVAQKIDWMQGLGTHSINGVMVETTINGKKSSDPVELPEEITIEVPMYVGCDPLPLTFDVSIDFSDKTGVMLRISSPDVRAKACQQFDQFARLIADALNEDCVVGLGSARHAQWEVLRA